MLLDAGDRDIATRCGFGNRDVARGSVECRERAHLGKAQVDACCGAHVQVSGAQRLAKDRIFRRQGGVFLRHAASGRIQRQVAVGGEVRIECDNLVANDDVVHRIQTQVALDPEHIVFVGNIRHGDVAAVDIQVIQECRRFKRLDRAQGDRSRGGWIGVNAAIPTDIDLAKTIGQRRDIGVVNIKCAVDWIGGRRASHVHRPALAAHVGTQVDLPCALYRATTT